VEILVTIVAFWLILAGAYGVYSLVQERSSEPAAPKMRRRRATREMAMIGPFAPPTLPDSKTPSFLVQRPAFSSLPLPERPIATVQEERAPPEPVAAAIASRRTPTEVDFLRAQVEHLRSEVNALSSNPERFERPQQRRYRTGNYTHLPRTLKRQVNEARDFRRHA
jgi:hypothetical protein